MKNLINKLFLPFRKINSFADSKSKITIFVYCIFITAFLGVIDYYTSPDYTFTFFYLLPVTISAWYSGLAYGAVISVFCAITTFMSVILWPDSTAANLRVLYWDAATNIFSFIFVALIMSRLKAILLRESRIARTDYLTGISNSRYFYELTSAEINRARRKFTFLSMIYFDLDNFKEVNDHMGHIEGDSVLRTAAETLKNNIRNMDTAARLGGDEFAVLMPETDFDEAENVIKRVKSMLDIVLQSDRWKVTVSMGAVTCPGQLCSVDSLITTADKLMYEAKAKGRDNVVHKYIFNEMPGPGGSNEKR